VYQQSSSSHSLNHLALSFLFDTNKILPYNKKINIFVRKTAKRELLLLSPSLATEFSNISRSKGLMRFC